MRGEVDRRDGNETNEILMVDSDGGRFPESDWARCQWRARQRGSMGLREARVGKVTGATDRRGAGTRQAGACAG